MRLTCLWWAVPARLTAASIRAEAGLGGVLLDERRKLGGQYC